MPLPTLRFAACAALVFGCVESPYSHATRVDTVEAYRAYLAEHRDASEAEMVRDRLAELEYQRAREAHSLVAYKRFLEEFPDSAQALKVEPILETLRFNAAKDKNTADGWRQFIKDHPNGAHRAEAQGLLVAAERAAAERSGSASDLGAFVARNPNDASRSAIEDQLDRTAFERAATGGPAELFAYLRSRPAGAHREQAQAMLFEARLEALLASGLVSEAREEAQRSPLARHIANLQTRLSNAEQEQKLRASKHPVVRAALPSSYLRSLDQLELGLRDSDAQVRWEAADELGHHVTVRAIDPLLTAMSSGRNPLVRVRALRSLGRILGALPPAVARYEIASRVETLQKTASSPELLLKIAALYDLGGDLERAAPEYQKSYDPNAPDPMVLHRWIEVRLSRRQSFSAAVAARQLAVWAEQTANSFEAGRDSGVTLQSARMLCAAQAMAEKATEAIAIARAATTEFPEDVAQFEQRAQATRKLVEAKLKDAELVLQVQLPEARLCADRSLDERLVAAEQARLSALAQAPKSGASIARMLWELAKRDPSEQVRAQAAQLLATPSVP